MVKKILVVLAVLIALGLAGLRTQHVVRTNNEKEHIAEAGVRIETDHGDYHVHDFGEGDALVFLAGLGTTSPLYDFRPLWELFADENRIVIIERPGYGHNTSSSRDKSLAATVSGYRAVLADRGIDTPVRLVAHSMAGLEALSWAAEHPEEIEGVIGLDISIPPMIKEHLRLPNMIERNAQWLVGFFGLPRFMDEATMKEALPLLEMDVFGDEDKESITALFHKNIFNRDTVREMAALKDNAKAVANEEKPSTVPVLIFLSEEYITDIDATESVYADYFAAFAVHERIILPTHHYLHHEEAAGIAAGIEDFFADDAD